MRFFDPEPSLFLLRGTGPSVGSRLCLPASLSLSLHTKSFCPVTHIACIPSVTRRFIHPPSSPPSSPPSTSSLSSHHLPLQGAVNHSLILIPAHKPSNQPNLLKPQHGPAPDGRSTQGSRRSRASLESSDPHPRPEPRTLHARRNQHVPHLNASCRLLQLASRPSILVDAGEGTDGYIPLLERALKGAVDGDAALKNSNGKASSSNREDAMDEEEEDEDDLTSWISDMS